MIDLSAGPGALGPRISPDHATPGAAIVSWIDQGPGKGGTLRWARVNPEGQLVDEGVVAPDPDMLLNWADMPLVTRVGGERPRWFAVWPRRFADQHHGYGLVFSDSEDGKNWSKPERLHDAEHGPEFGFPSVAAIGEGRLAVAWLDGRNSGGHGATDGAMQLRGRVWPGGSERLLDKRVCDCCGTETVASTDGSTWLTLYRDRSEDELRDVVAIDWSNPSKLLRRNDTVATPGWKIEGCPVNGPAAALDDAGALWTASFSAAGTRRVEVSRVTSASNRRFIVDEGAPLGRVDLVTLSGDSALVSWMRRDTEGSKRAQWVARALGSDGPSTESTPLLTLAGSRDTGFPRMTRLGEELLLLAWTEAEPDSPTRVRVATTPLSALQAAN